MTDTRRGGRPVMDASETLVVSRAIRTPRAAALAGIAFSVLFVLALVLVHRALPSDPHDAEAWLSDRSRRDAILRALSLVPFAGIAFLWFIGVVRDRIGEAEDRFFATVFLGSGLLFVAMVFVAAAVAAGLVASAGEKNGALVASSAWPAARHAATDLLSIYAMRMAAVFVDRDVDDPAASPDRPSLAGRRRVRHRGRPARRGRRLDLARTRVPGLGVRAEPAHPPGQLQARA